MAMEKLKSLDVERAHRKGKPVLLNDGGGLYLRKQTRAGSTWLFRYFFAGRERWMSLGDFPDMPLAEARIEARQQRVLIDKGKDPLHLRREADDAARRRGSFAQLCESWYQAEVANRDLKHPQVPRRYLDKYLLPKLGRLPSSEVTPADIARLLDEVKEDAPTAANDLLRFAKRIGAFGVRRHILIGNPAADFTPRLDGGGTERARSRALSYDELVKLFEAIRDTDNFGGENLLAVRLLLALCVRKGELLAAQWDEFDLKAAVWHLPRERTKTGQALDIPLSRLALEWLEALKVLAGASPFVFPKRRRDRRRRVPHMGVDTLNVALSRVEHGLPHFTLHDLRRTARTHLAALGVRREVAERCLGHALRGVEGTYDRHDYFEERRTALDQWTKLLQGAERGERKVVPIRQRKKS